MKGIVRVQVADGENSDYGCVNCLSKVTRKVSIRENCVFVCEKNECMFYAVKLLENDQSI